MLRSKKSLSQNFLTDKNICNKIIKQTNIIGKTILFRFFKTLQIEHPVHLLRKKKVVWFGTTEKLTQS